MANLVLVGAGQIGSRHLQALSLLKGQHNVYVVDPSVESLQLSRLRFDQVRVDQENGLSVQYLTDMSQLPGVIDVAIIATNSGPRRQVLLEILAKYTVHHFVLEKVLFPNLEDYEWAETQMSSHSAYVNCPLRMTDWSKVISAESIRTEKLFMNVVGSNLGLACNGIHFVDLFHFISRASLESVSTEFLERRVVGSKRSGYLELFGELHFTFEGGKILSLCSMEQSNVPCSIEIVSESARDYIYYQQPNSGSWRRARMLDGWEWTESSFSQPLQSQLTNRVVEDLLATGKCALTPLRDSIRLHRPMLHSLNRFFKSFELSGSLDCPIT